MEARSVVMGQAETGWAKAHEELCELRGRRGELDWLEAGALLRALRANVHRHLGFASFAEYLERLFGYTRRAVDDKLRTALALEELPLLSQALRNGAMNASAVRELARVATPETEQEWLDAARGRTVHQIERMVSGHARGDRPTDAADPAAQRHVLRFEVSAETLAHVREAFAAMRNRSAESLDDDAVLLLMAREVLAGPADDGTASYQVAITTCDHCLRGFQQAAGELIELEAPVVAMASCDAQYLGCVELRGTQNGSSSTDVTEQSPIHAEHGGAEGREHESTHAGLREAEHESMHVSLREAEHASTHVSSREAEDESTRVSLRETERESTHVDSRRTEYAATHVGHVKAESVPAAEHGRSGVGYAQRATQTIPPALRRRVMRRDHGCCVVPGCRHHRFVDLHHLKARSDGGDHGEDNLVVLCSAHHRALHQGRFSIHGRVSTGLSFRHADGRPYGDIAPRHLDAEELVYRGLRRLGFRDEPASRALALARTRAGAQARSPATLIRAALAVLVPEPA